MTEAKAGDREEWGWVVRDRVAKLEGLRARGVEP